ncbi:MULTISPECIES: protein-disulfide reductase DsbD domain-containing protein [Methylomonas]|uniref:protein-disulfide reductase DsbD domain-containing protein n=1 Tax=Methylomonas TaxID=416 RepID=UPI000A430052|nr:protein-disulfide reductase DsbD domain-containing protein [Methylomonas koyamae]
MSGTAQSIIAFTFFLGLVPAFAGASPTAKTDQVEVELLASAEAVRPGDRIWIGVHQKIIPHWHTYWKNPGDSGLPTRIQYQLPPGASVGEIEWPTPEKFVLGPVVNYGYQAQVTLLSPLTIAADAPVGAPLRITADVKWLVCEEICIPQQASLTIDLPVIDKTAPVGPEPPLIAAARASWPQPAPWPAELIAVGDRAEWRFGHAPTLVGQKLEFFPEAWGPVAHGAEQPVALDGDAVSLGLHPGDQALAAGQSLEGLLVVGEGGERRAYTVRAAWPAGIAAVAPPSAQTVALASAPADADLAGDVISLPFALLLALAGGLTLNLMPCVFPVLSLKALALVEQAGQARRLARLHGWAYLVGVVASFLALAGILTAVKSAGAGVGWGFQFQSPWFVLLVAYLMLAVGLSLSGVFQIGAGITGVGSVWAARGGYVGSFATGVLATVVATPCTAPFMGAAVGFALTQPMPAMFAVFASLGVGLALPFWLLSQWPALQRCLPRPGAWMETLKQGLAFPMYAAAAWLIWVLRQLGVSWGVGRLFGDRLRRLAVPNRPERRRTGARPEQRRRFVTGDWRAGQRPDRSDVPYVGKPCRQRRNRPSL